LETFSYEGYKIPVDLVNLTGGGTETWDAISKGHMREYEEYAPIKPDHTVLEVGCGVGRDAIQLTKVLSPQGRYIGFDIIQPSIEWCQKNITTKFPNFEFHYYHVYSQIHNAGGTDKVTSVRLPAADKSVDRIVLHSVFTHMFRDDIFHYFNEFRRVLKNDGLVMASFFVLDKESREMAKTSEFPLKFETEYGEGCWINDKDFPEGAIGYDLPVIEQMLKESGLKLVQDIHRGYWSGRKGVTDGQDILVLGKDPAWKPGLLRRLKIKK
jgi:ubiquinone/menaquinone biosynthesis C-methylase UbiE